MGGDEKQVYKEDSSMKNNLEMRDDNSSEESSSNTNCSSCSSEILLVEDEEDALNSSYGPLYHLTDLMAHLPIMRGLSKYYNGKSQSYGCLGSVNSLEDLAKKGISLSKRMKSCKSFGGGLNGKIRFGPKATINKKSSRKPPICPKTH